MKAIKLTAKDNVATVLDTTAANTDVEVIVDGKVVDCIVAKEEIPFGFKICTAAMQQNDPVIKYSHVIGIASKPIAVGELVHIHNIEGNRGRGDLE